MVSCSASQSFSAWARYSHCLPAARTLTLCYLRLHPSAWCHCVNPSLQPADIYLIDEPSAYLDSEQRIIAAKVIKRFILHAKKTGFVVEHDFIMAT